jgi:hypothetical protein
MLRQNIVPILRLCSLQKRVLKTSEDMPSMAESITRSEQHSEGTSAQAAENQTISTQAAKENVSSASYQSPIIWTPRFIVIFALTLTIGLSLASLFTQGWDNHYYQPGWILLGDTAIIFGIWIAIVIRARSQWVRIGGIFACLWSVFTGINFIANLLMVNPDLAVIAYLNAITNLALFGYYFVFSTNNVPFLRWDRWFFRIVPILGVCLALPGFFFPPIHVGGLPNLASSTAAVALYLTIVTWWLRPSCWKSQSGPAFFLGLAPLILLMLAIPHTFNGSSNFFFLQISLLCSLLGAMRILQGEIRQNA